MKTLVKSQSQRLCILLFWLFELMAIVGGSITLLTSQNDMSSLAAAAGVAWILGAVGLLLVLRPLGRISTHLQTTAMITCLMTLLMTMMLPAN